jgi:hypothetical protein
MFIRLPAVLLGALVLWSCAGEARDPTGPSDQARVTTPADWRTYTDAMFGFVVSYPADLVILPEAVLPAVASPAPLRRVWFQEKTIASGEFAGREPARLAIQVYDKPASMSLLDWLRSSGLARAGASTTPVRLQGAREGLRVTLQQQVAPNDFIYLATDTHVFGLVPLGEHSDQMVASFRLTAP